ncbi:bifunctional alpha,alpha-trehalose-phosphate synthase (UDP-forming)/trehalose-phosphatase [Massilibacteroides sp.]|uniref:bifunctional alpha,alpha-trehalose-phosphate synthase (UDP-forming)/trehalose-phosphatase n=1 Tax=Massilibacteroides sp. TaxID=2034766 RepID=UPI002620319F|nr:bifunctional alpha,alpha-trehalose-phosphate synthase (UDP-forming)/trehalose-phosphatase [Massilibacteroides sp.]MDD4515707.1 bifunctional alpha,alpha-trehalose-phosphate synthase (UDP-forming)/trehalose-phosphatase [Massilibacteroides sp.]
MRLFIISNRLPLKTTRTEAHFAFTPSEGGLTTGLASLTMDIEKHWVGWPGMYFNNEKEEEEVSEHLLQYNFHPVFLSECQVEEYYEGYSNGILWPLCHYFFSYIRYENSYWKAYQEVNHLFLETLLPLLADDDIVWVQDYHLMLLPQMIREKNKKVNIGYFHHIPFPSYELFRVLPERAELLNGLLGADLVAFHTHDYMRHFVSAAERVLDLQFQLDKVKHNNRLIYVDAFPMGINYDRYHDAILNPKIQHKAKKLKQTFGDSKLILSVDRLDYSKGIIHRLKGFLRFLENHPESIGQVSLAMIIVPSRANVEEYSSLKTNIDEMIGRINGQYSKINWTPVYYFYHSFCFEDLIAMYSIADIALVTPLRDGMNLVAKEYLAVKRDTPGVLILSEMAGSAIELNDAIIVNPNDTEEIANAIYEALQIPEEEQQASLKNMQQKIMKQNVNKWAADFVNELHEIKERNIKLHKKRIGETKTKNIALSYTEAKKRLFILDYDGTLVGFKRKAEDAVPTEILMDTLKKLSENPQNHIAISSGRDHDTLERWFGHLPITLAAEHGAFFKENGKWYRNADEFEWDNELLRIFQLFVDKTPHSKMEIKNTAIVWHYRNVDSWFASLRERQLVNELMEPCARLNLQILRGNKIVEVKSPLHSKGTEVQRLLAQDDYDFILAMGDDTTDEDTFRALPEEAITIKVGSISEIARFYLDSQSETIPFLRQISNQGRINLE